MLSSDSMGNLSGSLLLYRGFTFTTGFYRSCIQTALLRFPRSIRVRKAILNGKVIRLRGGAEMLSGSFIVSNAGAVFSRLVPAHESGMSRIDYPNREGGRYAPYKRYRESF